MIGAESTIEWLYHGSGILSGLCFIYIAYLLNNDRKKKIKSMIFLKYDRFRTAFYVVTLGSAIWMIGNILGLYGHEQFETAELFGETVFNMTIFIFAGIIITIFNPSRRQKI